MFPTAHPQHPHRRPARWGTTPAWHSDQPSGESVCVCPDVAGGRGPCGVAQRGGPPSTSGHGKASRGGRQSSSIPVMRHGQQRHRPRPDGCLSPFPHPIKPVSSENGPERDDGDEVFNSSKVIAVAGVQIDITLPDESPNRGRPELLPVDSHASCR